MFPEPTFFDTLSGGGDKDLDQIGDHKPTKSAEAAEAVASEDS